MSHQTNWVCDRCGAGLSQGAGYGVGLEVKYHHPSLVELCPRCEDEFTLWLGKHPMWGTTIEQIAGTGIYMGAGYPDKATARQYLQANG